MQLSNAIRKRLINLIKDKNVNIWFICKKTGIPCSTITTFLNGKTKLIKIDNLFLICEALEISLSQFFDDKLFIDVDID